MAIALSILGFKPEEVQFKLKEMESNLLYLHLDVMDGIFVPNHALDLDFIRNLRHTSKLFFDTHLMMVDVESHYLDYVDAGCDSITFHYEACRDPNYLIKKIKDCGLKVGMALNPDTKIEVLEPFLSDLDLVLVMSVFPGYGGQAFMPNAIEKVKKLQEWKKNCGYRYLIEIDGGINAKTLELVKDYIDIAVVGSYITSSPEPLKQLKNLDC